jgi:hypothetical protein
VVQDPGLVKCLIDVFRKLNQEFITNPLDEDKYFTLYLNCVDLKYLAKPVVLPIISKKSNIVDEIIRVMAIWHFVDVCNLPN